MAEDALHESAVVVPRPEELSVHRSVPVTRMGVVTLIVAAIVAGCSGASTPTPADGGTTPAATVPPAGQTPAASVSGGGGGAAGPVTLQPGLNLCTLLTAVDFAAAGVPGAGGPSKNNPDPSDFYCVYKGRSGATGGIEFDASILDPRGLADIEMWSAPSVGGDPVEVKAQIPGADKAMMGKANDSGVDFALVNVLSGNLFFGISAPPEGDWQGSLVSLAKTVLQRAEAAAKGG